MTDTESWANYKKAELTDAQFLESMAVEVGPTPKEGETRAYRNAFYPEDLVETFPTRPQCDNLYTLLEYMVKNDPEKPFLGTRAFNEDGTRGEYVYKTYGEVGIQRKKIADGIKSLVGAEAGDRVGIFAKNRHEWLIAEYACYCHSYVPVALYDTLGENAVSFVIEHSDMPICVCSGDHIEKILVNYKDYPKLKAVISMEKEVPEDHLKLAETAGLKLLPFAELEALGERNPVEDFPCKIDDLSTIMYTSGSTGNPKGVQLTHRAFLAVASGLYHHDAGPIIFAPEVRHFSYLPLAHSFERAACCAMLAAGGRIGFFTGDLKDLLSDLDALKPTFMIGAPRVFQRIFDRIKAKIAAGSFITRGIFNLAYWWKSGSMASGGHQMAHAKGGWTDAIVFKKTQALLGGECRLIVSGSAPLDPQVGDFLKVVLCTPIVQGYGLTENAAGASVGWRMDGFAQNHTGPPLPSMEIKLVDVPEMNYRVTDKPFPRGEVCLRGPSVFTGYYKDEEKTKADLEEDGWFHSGDIGQFNENNCLMIIDRKKNIFKLSQGEYVAAEYLETIFTRSPLVQQIFVYGDSLRNYLVAVVVPSPDTIPPVARSLGVTSDKMKDICASDTVRDAILDSMKVSGQEAKLKGFEFAKAIYLEEEPFSVENDLLTPTFKPKRPQLKEKYKAVIDKLYSE